MRLLIITQVMERKDPALGFFARWVEEFAKRVTDVRVICLREGEWNPYASAENSGAMFRRVETPIDKVKVYTLGKEHEAEKGSRILKRIRYIVRFYRLLFRLRGTYDAVFVHMNEEYIFLAGLLWKLFSIPVYLWRNHYDGSWKTKLAGTLSKKVFYTSRYSYTASFSNAEQMPVGVDVESVHPDEDIARIKSSILFLARFDESKRPLLLVEALGMLKKQGVTFIATFVGGPTKKDSPYPEMVKQRATELGVAEQCRFVGAVPNTETYRYYRSHETFVNCSESGMLDKTIFKAAASGAIALSSSKDIAEYVDASCIYKNNDAQDLARGLKHILSLSEEEHSRYMMQFDELVKQNTLPILIDKVLKSMNVADFGVSKGGSSSQ